MSGTLRLKGSTSGYSELQAPAVAGDQTFILPAAGGTLLTTDSPAPTLTLESGTVTSPSLTFEGDSNTGIYSPGANQLAITTGGGQRLVADASGNIGVGTGSPSFALDVQKNVNTLARFIRNTDGDSFVRINSHGGNLVGLQLGDDTDVDKQVIYADNTNNALRFNTANSEKMRIDSNGNIGIGTASPGAKLEISEPTGSTTPAKMRFQNVGERGVVIGFDDHSVSPDFSISSNDQSTKFITIAPNGDVNISSDLAVKTDTLYVDTTNDRVGIGTTSPSEALDIQGGLIINGGNITAILSGTIGDDTFYNIDLTAAGFMLGGVAIITTFSTYSNFPQPIGTGIFYYDCGNSLSGARILADADGSTPLNGGTTSNSTTITDFTDNRVTIICNTNTLRIANRMGSNRIFKLTFL